MNEIQLNKRIMTPLSLLFVKYKLEPGGRLPWSMRNSYPSLAKNTHIQTALKLSDWGLTESNLFYKLQQNSLIFLDACWHWRFKLEHNSKNPLYLVLELVISNSFNQFWPIFGHTGQPYLYIYFPLLKAYSNSGASGNLVEDDDIYVDREVQPVIL